MSKRKAKSVRSKSKITLKPQANMTTMPTTWDQGATGPANQINLRTEAATDMDPETGREAPNPNGVKRRRREPWVARYHRQGKLTAAHVAAASKLFSASAGLPDRDPLAAIGDVKARGGCKLAARIDARRYFFELLGQIPPSSRAIVEHVVICDNPIWNGNSAQRERYMSRLRDGLDAIC